MEILKYCKFQIGIILLFLFVNYLFIKDGNKLNKMTQSKKCNKYFDMLLLLGEVALIFDAITVYTVNHLEQVPDNVNMILHLMYLLSYQLFIFYHFLYWLSVTDSKPKNLGLQICCYAPIAVSILITVMFIKDLYYKNGEYINYAKGVSAYASFASITLYSILTLIMFFLKKNYIHKNKRTAFIMSFIAVTVILIIQMVFNETLVAGIAVALVIISIYLCMENPSIKSLEFYHSKMITGFANLVESKDGSTGGHIRRTSAYAVLIAKQLRNKPKYKNIITKDYIDNLNKAAPMHDVGKIGVPDSILQKPGKLTEEEFDIMKKHPEKGGEIIKKSFGKLDDEEYEDMAYNVAMYHHEKWNGSGYPIGLSGLEIPMCARIMAVADVFDAVSAKRCYRDAMPLDVCFKIISNGHGKEFDPDVVDAFFDAKNKVEEIYHSTITGE